jgi:signal transduction histidine kinase
VEAKAGGRFNLIQYFALTSLAAVVGVAFLATFTLGALMRRAMVQEAEADAIAVARLMAAEFDAELDALAQAGASIQWMDPEIQSRLSEAFTRSGGALGVVKVKVFDASGQIIYSTDLSLIGEVDADNPDLQTALAGQVTSELARAERVADLRGETFVADVIETYVPVGGETDSTVQVFEIYQDASDILGQVRAAQQLLVSALVGILLLLFIVLYLIVRRAAQVIDRQTAELQAANAELVQLEQLKTDLTNMIVHDMKNPLTAIQGYAALLSRSGSMTETQARFVQTIDLSAHRLLTMIVNLLNISRLEEGQLELDRAAVPARQVVETVVAETSELLASEDKTLHVDLPDDLSPLWIDRDLIARVLDNLVSNAAKHTERGGNIWISARAGVAPGTLVLSIRDDGEGIPREFQEVIFEKFRQAEGRHLGLQTDTGLGLAFCKLAVEAHGGTIGVESEVGRGSTFALTLPLAPPG